MNSSFPHLVIGLVVLSVVAGGMMCVGNYWKKFADAVQPKGGSSLEKPPPLAEAAPEVVKNREAFRALANQARFAIGRCQKQPANFKTAIGQGKVVVWDLGDGDLSEALVRVPAELRATSADGPLTFLLIGKQEDVPLDMYYHKQQPGTFPQFYFGETDVRAYRVDTEVCAVAMPGVRPLGKFTIAGDHPPGSIEMLRPGQKKVVGDWTPSIGRFAELCVKGVPPPPPPEIIPKGKEGLLPLIAEAKKVIGECERKTQGQRINKLPKQAVVWQFQPKDE